MFSQPVQYKVMDVISSLKQTSKGRLKYDRDALSGCNAKRTIERIYDGNLSISVRFNPKKPQVSRKVKISKNLSPINFQNSYYEDFDDCQLEVNDSFNDIMDYENTRKSYVNNAMDLKIRFFNENYENIQTKAEQSLKVLNHEKALQQMKKLEKLKHRHDKGLKEAFEVKKKQQENSKQHLKLLHEKIKQAEMKQKIREEEKQSQEMERQGRLSVVMEGLVITSNFLAQMKSQIDNCESREYISPECYEAVNHVLINCGKIKNIVAQAEKGVVLTDEDISLVQMTVAKLSSTLQTVTLHIEIANGEAEKALKLKTEAQTSKKEIKSSIKFESIDKKETEKKLIKNELLEYVSIDCLKNNVRLKENLKMCQDSISSFVNDPNLKKYRFQLQKAVNTTVNTIGNTSGSHLKEKLNHLHSLMSGQSVEVGGKMVSPSQHELGLKFCKELLAKKLVRQGEEQVASNHDSAFAFAMVIVAVSTDFPDIGDLIIAHFYERCPYLVPYYIPRQEGQSDEEHYRELGYHFVDGVIEKQDKFLKRMSGIVRLYAATIASKPPPKRYEAPKHNIHGLRFGWKWLAEVLNLDPRPDITATLLFNFLEVAGHEMSNIYKTQFQKLLHAMCREFFPKIKAVTPDGSGGPVLRLETLLQKAISKQGRFPKPSGCIDSKFWST